MDGTTIIIVVAIFALIVIGAFVVYPKVKVRLKAGGMGLDIDGSNDKPPAHPGVHIADAVSDEGGIEATDKTGRGVNIERVNTRDTIRASSEEPDHPKA